MANIFRNNLNLCFSKIRCLPIPPLPNEGEEEHKNPPSIPQNPKISFVLENYDSLYNDLVAIDSCSSNSKSQTSSSTDQDLLSLSDDFFDDNADNIPEISTIFNTKRFFFSSPGNSKAISKSPENLPQPESPAPVISGGVAIQTYSPNPYADFRKSMQEMVEAYEFRDVKAFWEFLHELLLCYLDLNPKQTHKLIIKAFTDLIVSLMSSDDNRPEYGQKTDSQQQQCPLHNH